MSWKFAAALAVFVIALIYVIAKLWRPFDPAGRAELLWKRRA